MNIFLPLTGIDKGNVNKFVNIGSFKDRLVAILNNSLEDVLVTELSDEEYLNLRGVLIDAGVDYKLVVNMPDVVTPPSFLFEANVDKIISFDNLDLREKTDAEKLLESFEDANQEEAEQEYLRREELENE